VRVVNVTPGGQAGWWLRGAAGVLGLLAVAAAVVSWQAQYVMVVGVKHAAAVAAIEAAIPDAGAVIFAALGVALALHGKRALRPRALNAACVGISLAMNALAAGHGWRDLAIWVMPAAVYALASDTLIGVVRAWVLARQQASGEVLAEDGPTPLALVGSLALWLLRLALAPRSTLTGFRGWVVRDCPVGPGLRPGHVADLAAVRKEAVERIAVAAGQRDEAVGRAAAEARQARDEAARAQGAEAAIRSELEQQQAEATRLAIHSHADAAREREATRTWAGQQLDALRAELQRAHEDAAGWLGEVRDTTAARVSAVEDARTELRARAEQAQKESDALRAERDRFAAQLQALALPRRTVAARRPKARAALAAEPSKRDQMIQLAGQRCDLASVPLNEVSKLASVLAGEIGYSPGTARRELLGHVRALQSGTDDTEETSNDE
jgi:hypothetical protein